MASSNKDNSMEYDRQMYKKTEKSKNHLASRLNKFQEKLNQNQSSSMPHPISSHQWVNWIGLLDFNIYF